MRETRWEDHHFHSCRGISPRELRTRRKSLRTPDTAPLPTPLVSPPARSRAAQKLRRKTPHAARRTRTALLALIASPVPTRLIHVVALSCRRLLPTTCSSPAQRS